MKKSIKQLLSKSIITVVIATMAIFQPIAIALAADEATVETPSTTLEQTSTPAESQATPTVAQPAQGPEGTPGPTKPNGVDGSTYKKNDAGQWENENYIWDPVTHQTRPKQLPDYTYDPKTGTWSTNDWEFNAVSGKYEPVAVSVPAAIAAALGLVAPATKSSISNTGPNSNNQIDYHDQANGMYNLFSRSEIANYFNLDSLSGNADVLGNTHGGSATTGDAEVLANIVNMLRSAWGVTGGSLKTFVQNLFGDVNGDITMQLDKSSQSANARATGNTSLIDRTGPNSNNTINHDYDCQGERQEGACLQINTTDLNTITNNLNLNAKSGDATVSGNTRAGDAKSGEAKVLLNLLNFISSAISAHDSFFGLLNIFGDFNGDILLPDGFVDNFSAGNDSMAGDRASISNTGANSNNQITDEKERSLIADTNSVDNINNNIVANAQSGNADVSRDTKAGNATSGNSDSKLTILNLTGKNVVAKNAILVFVNVFGKWIGMIMDAPAGAKSGVLTGGQQALPPLGSTEINSDSENTITNNLNLNAQSGDAVVSENTEAGNATSGDAKILANVGNIINSNFSLSDWFGVLFINVFGNWTGSFGVNTPAGNSSGTSLQNTEGASTNNSQTSSNSNKGVLSQLSIPAIVTTISNTGSSSNNVSSINASQNKNLPTSYHRSGSNNNPYLWPLVTLFVLTIAAALFAASKKSKL